MIVKNESENLKKYLLQIKDFFDEIIIVDTGSTDSTIEIAKNIASSVFSFEWNDSFSEAKNYAISKVQGEWILFLDADELVTKEDLDLIKTVIQQTSSDAFRLQVINYLDQETSGALPNKSFPFTHPFFIKFRLARLFKNKAEYKYKYRVHEMIEESIEENKGTITELNACIHHFGTLQLKEKKENYYEKLVLKQLEEMPNDKRALYYAGKLFAGKKEYSKAITLFEKIKEIDSTYKNIHAKVGQLYFLEKNLTEAINNYKKSIFFTLNINQKAKLVNQLAFLYLKNNQADLSMHVLKTFLTFFSKNPESDNKTKSMLEMNLKKLAEHLNKTPNNQ